MNKKTMLQPLLAGFFVMGFGDIIGTVMNQIKAECAKCGVLRTSSRRSTANEVTPYINPSLF